MKGNGMKKKLPCVNCDLDLGNMSQVKVMIRLRDILSRSNLAVITYGPDTVLGMCALWPWPQRYDLGSRSWHTLGSLTIIVWNIIQIQLGNEELWPGHRFWVCVQCDLDLEDMTSSQGHDTSFGHRPLSCKILSRSNLPMRSYGPDTDFGYVCTVTLTLEIWPWVKVMTHSWVIDNKCVKYYPDPTWQWGVMARTRISGICTLWPWPWRYDLGWRSWHTLGSWTTIVWNIIQIQLGSEELWPRHGFPYVCTVTLTLEIWPWVKVMTHPWVMDNNCVKLYPDRTREYEVMVRTQCEQTDRQTDRQGDSYMPPKLCLRGYNQMTNWYCKSLKFPYF